MQLQPDGALSLTTGTALKQWTPSLTADNCESHVRLCAFTCTLSVKYRQYPYTGATVHEKEIHTSMFGNKSIFAVPSEGPWQSYNKLHSLTDHLNGPKFWGCLHSTCCFLFKWTSLNLVAWALQFLLRLCILQMLLSKLKYIAFNIWSVHAFTEIWTLDLAVACTTVFSSHTLQKKKKIRTYNF